MAHTPSSSTSHLREFSSRFKEHLSIYIPPAEYPVVTSRFSPESPPSPPPPPPRTLSSWTNTATMRSFTPTRRDIEEPPTPKTTSTAQPTKSRMAKLLLDIRALVRDEPEPDVVQIQPADLPPWPPLSVEKRTCCHDCPCHSTKSRKRKWRRRILTYTLVVILLYLLGNTVVLDVRVFGTSSSNDSGTNNTSSPSKGLSADEQQCVTQYTVNAPSDPSGYPCSSCLSVLQSISPSVLANDSQTSQTVQNAIQFCGLRSIFETTASDGQSALQNGNWAQDVKFCAWSGVACDGMGRVSSLSLTFPGVPASLPDELGALTGLQSLSVVGNSASPGGSLPNSFTSWTSLSSLHLESTSMSSLPDNLFTALPKITTFTLIKNADMGNTLSSSITGSSLQNLVVNGQTLTNPLPSLSSSPSLQASLKLLDLSSTNISGTIPGAISSLSSLVELHLDSNNLSTPLPGAFPSSLQSLTLTSNSQLAGPVSGSFCSLGSLQQCNVQGTALSAPSSGCSVCQFSHPSAG